MRSTSSPHCSSTPSSPERQSASFIRSRTIDVAAGRIGVPHARVTGSAVGTAQLRLNQYPNGLHRAEVAKVLVRRGRTLLVLDTITGSDAVKLYETLGWTRAGEIPRYAAMPDGTLAATTYFYKELA